VVRQIHDKWKLVEFGLQDNLPYHRITIVLPSGSINLDWISSTYLENADVNGLYTIWTSVIWCGLPVKSVEGFLVRKPKHVELMFSSNYRVILFCVYGKIRILESKGLKQSADLATIGVIINNWCMVYAAGQRVQSWCLCAGWMSIMHHDWCSVLSVVMVNLSSNFR